jgi:hypothetical protein
MHGSSKGLADKNNSDVGGRKLVNNAQSAVPVHRQNTSQIICQLFNCEQNQIRSQEYRRGMPELQRNDKQRKDLVNLPTTVQITEQFRNVFKREMPEERHGFFVADELNVGVDDSWLVFLQSAGHTPTLAGCTKCDVKFFTPRELMKKPQAATDYLRWKFGLHSCKWGVERLRLLRIVTSSLGICKSCNVRFLAPVYLRGDAEQAEYEVRRQFRRHVCKLSDAA